MVTAASDAEFFRALRAREFSRLDESVQAYLDYTGSGQYVESQIRWHRDWLSARVLGNPHSENPASLAATDEVDRVTARVLDFFGADPAEYELVFTANATAALKLVGEAFPFGPGSRYVLATDNHNSVGGIREYARRAGATCTCLPLDDELRLDDPEAHMGQAGRGPSLFAFPAQSNFSGVKHPPELVAAARERGFRAMENRITAQERDLAHLRARARALSPLATLDRGYAVVVGPGGELVRAADQLHTGDEVRVRVSTGHFRADVTDVASAS